MIMLIKNKSFNIKILLLLMSLIIFSCSKTKANKDYMYGLTIDDSWYETIPVEEITLSLKGLKIKPTVRIVMSKNIHPKEYVQLFKILSEVAYIMAEPVDSYEMNLYKDVKSYKDRFFESYKYLNKYVDIWEIGNEINGQEWINQSSELIISKVMAAYNIVKNKKTAITFYYENQNSNKNMFQWIKDNIPKDLSENITYSFISYYEDENQGFQPDWTTIFNDLSLLFPNAKIGIGECGNISKEASEESKIALFNKYYSMPKYNDNYVGGYFWWDYIKDCIPINNNRVYKSTVYKYFNE